MFTTQREAEMNTKHTSFDDNAISALEWLTRIVAASARLSEQDLTMLDNASSAIAKAKAAKEMA